ncbi:GRAM domain-containing protein 2B-like isoform X2 [Diachasmimorpha longicaudata]|uniref:GRAM domain-containing protein 2B-like isoform X2 n=1 Tax=Diachasmimorpha longicaudata TaxID=58733 RepID=UPI0030B87311
MAIRNCDNGDDPGGPLRRGGSLNLRQTKIDSNHLLVPTNIVKGIQVDRTKETLTSGRRPARYTPPALTAPAPQHLAVNLLQLGCPLVYMPRPRGGVGSEHQPPSSDSDDSITYNQGRYRSREGHVHGGGPPIAEGYGLPKVQVSAPTGSEAANINGSAGSIGARSAPSTPLQAVGSTQHSVQDKHFQQSSASGSQLTVGANHAAPPRSPSHTTLQKCNDSQLSKPLSRSTPSMTGGSQAPAVTAKSSTRSPTSTSSARQKKFHRHFTQSSKFHDQVAPDERVLNYYSCALVGDILLQGHLYITPNYFAFYSNVFGYVTKLLIPTVSVRKISKEKTARIIPNAIAVATDEERHVFCSLLSRDSTFKLMKQVWDAAIEGSQPPDEPLPVEAKLLTPETLLVDDSEVNPEEDDSSMSESGTDLNSRPTTVCTDDTDGITPTIPRPISPPPKLDLMTQTTVSPAKVGILRSMLRYQLKPTTMIAILIGLLAALYISAALMMVRIDKLHNAYLNHPLASPEKFTHDRLLHYLNTNLDQVVKVRQSLQTLSQQFVKMGQDNDHHQRAGDNKESEGAPS